ncbi:MAG: CRISPR-associated protein Cas4 [Lachnospiraceae bacterium]|nr:CRISPR-associated protein Cas4 [Lachnospiraceae bacterium]
MEYKEDDFLMVSGIQHFAFCRRQWALIHIENQWAENVHTIEGELMHRRAHDPRLNEKVKDTLYVRALPIQSRKLGLSGECDVVEFHKSEDGVKLFGHRGLYQIYPVEYKRGKPKNTEIDILQLTAQIMCLEEMFCTEIFEGAIFYGEIKRREKVLITKELRCKVQDMLTEMHQLYQRGWTPKVKWSKSCNACSLREICLPKLGKVLNVKQYISQIFLEDQG